MRDLEFARVEQGLRVGDLISIQGEEQRVYSINREDDITYVDTLLRWSEDREVILHRRYNANPLMIKDEQLFQFYWGSSLRRELPSEQTWLQKFLFGKLEESSIMPYLREENKRFEVHNKFLRSYEDVA